MFRIPAADGSGSHSPPARTSHRNSPKAGWAACFPAQLGARARATRGSHKKRKWTLRPAGLSLAWGGVSPALHKRSAEGRGDPTRGIARSSTRFELSRSAARLAKGECLYISVGAVAPTPPWDRGRDRRPVRGRNRPKAGFDLREPGAPSAAARHLRTNLPTQAVRFVAFVVRVVFFAVLSA